jgi:hypothetical protein
VQSSLVLLVVVVLGGNSFASNVPAANVSSNDRKATPASGSSAPIGVTYGGWKGDYRDAVQRIAVFKDIGFRIVSFVPTYAYVGLNKIDLPSGPGEGEFRTAIEAARRAGLSVVIKPHLDPPLYRPGFNAFASENTSWRVHCAWRGFFDVDPMSDDYRMGIVFGSLRLLKTVLDTGGADAGGTAAPVRLELGAELMNSVVYGPERWEQLLAVAKTERHRLGLDGRVILSHNFTHHFEILDDFVGRMNVERRGSLARYIRGLDALSVSQYMDLTVAVPKSERGKRLPTADEVARALLLHEKNFRQDILQTALGMKPDEIPPLHIGEFGVGRGGLMHPNLWDGAATPEQEQGLAREITRGHEGLIRYLSLGEGRKVNSAILWVTGPHYDVFGWGNPDFAIPEAAAAIKAGLRPIAGGRPH